MSVCLQEDESSLRQEVQTLQAQLDWTRIQLHRITAVLLDPVKPARDNSRYSGMIRKRVGFEPARADQSIAFVFGLSLTR